jgi:molybdenum cofactor sulfurtransferase
MTQLIRFLDAIYLDHAGTTLYSKSLMERFAADMISNLYGNPHSASASSQLSTRRIEDIRLRVLQFFKADPDDYEVVFVANATAGIKLVMDAFRGCPDGFIYGYHKDAHTSLVGVRETALASRCLTDEDVEEWLSGSYPLVDRTSGTRTTLFAYPAQSNMNGRRLPLSWPAKIRSTSPSAHEDIYSLLDAAALVSTAQLDLSDASTGPDFIVLSFYKIFGFPDLGALIVRKASGQILRNRKYFGGGTVDMVVSVKEQWHVPKEQSLYESLEDGTLPIHNIMALETSMKVHDELFKSMNRISRHTSYLAKRLYHDLRSLRHANGETVCEMYSSEADFGGNSQSQGPVVAFNLRNSHGAWMSNTEVEKLASVQHIHIRTGGLCNPGGLATSIDLEPWEMKRNFSSGFRCGNENDIIGGKPTGVIRTSLGAMSTISDVDIFIDFIREFYVECSLSRINDPPLISPEEIPGLFVESLTIYPIKSCGGLSIPTGIDWEVRKEGLAWDREWCLIHQGTGQALSQKRYPRMALIRPSLDFEAGLLRVKYHGSLPQGLPSEVVVALSADPRFYQPAGESRSRSSRVCGDVITAHTYSSKTINDFFTRILDVPCTLARFPAGGLGPSTRHSKAHMQKHQQPKDTIGDSQLPGTFSSPLTPPDSDTESVRPILLSNESPILLINRSSINALNEEIEKTGGKPASASVFRANVVVASSHAAEQQKPYSEDHWSSLHIGQQEFKMLGSCRRCHMICVDQYTAVKDSEPFVTLAKTRRFDGKVFFGSHMCHNSSTSATKEQQYPTVRIGDPVTVSFKR